MDSLVKSNYEIFPIYIDYSIDTGQNETITPITQSAEEIQCVEVVTGIDSRSDMIVLLDNTIIVRGGELGKIYKLTVKATTNLGNVFEKDIFIKIENKIYGNFTKQPSDAFVIAFDFTNRLDTENDTISVIDSVSIVRLSDSIDVTNTLGPLPSIEKNKKVLLSMWGGIDGEKYLITVKISTTAAYKYEMKVIMIVKEI